MPNPAPMPAGETLTEGPVVLARIYPTQYDQLQALTASSGETTSGLIRRLVTAEIQRHEISEEVTVST